MTDHTPTTDEVRFAMAGLMMYPNQFVTNESFNRWLQKVKAEVWEEGYADGRFNSAMNLENPYL